MFSFSLTETSLAGQIPSVCRKKKYFTHLGSRLKPITPDPLVTACRLKFCRHIPFLLTHQDTLQRPKVPLTYSPISVKWPRWLAIHLVLDPTNQRWGTDMEVITQTRMEERRFLSNIMSLVHINQEPTVKQPRSPLTCQLHSPGF